MNPKKYRTLLVSSHPVQYAVPVYRLIEQNSYTDLTVAFCTLQGAESKFDSGFGINIQWDIPLLDGYKWLKLKNYSPKPELGSFWGLINGGLFPLIKSGQFDAVIVHTGYNCASFWIAVLACKLGNVPLLFNTDAHSIEPRDRQKWKTLIKKLILPRIFKLADIVTAPSTGAFNFVHSLGIPKERIQATCYTVDNDWWISQSQKVDRTTVRKRWGIPIDARVALFCAKLQPWKRPQDALQAFAAAKVPDSYLVIAGDGPMRSELEEEAKRLKISAYVRFLGFVNQSELPSVYTSSDIFLFTSEYEPFGVVVNEAMLCKCPVIASDQVGSGIDLIVPGQTGMIYEATNIQDLSKNLSKLFLDSDFLQKMSLSAFQKIQAWSPDVAADTLCQGIIKAIEQ